ncbi:TPA: hypothetical protein HA361_04195 [Candidatus Woesearchaeota archaeon]|nr:hypothetical protein [Candidatus Woesearchaeota archaeon]HII68621.1 hypothetical protein [Candidatus Woesearchaeota archaeon]
MPNPQAILAGDIIRSHRALKANDLLFNPDNNTVYLLAREFRENIKDDKPLLSCSGNTCEYRPFPQGMVFAGEAHYNPEMYPNLAESVQQGKISPVELIGEGFVFTRRGSQEGWAAVTPYDDEGQRKVMVFDTYFRMKYGVPIKEGKLSGREATQILHRHEPYALQRRLCLQDTLEYMTGEHLGDVIINSSLKTAYLIIGKESSHYVAWEYKGGAKSKISIEECVIGNGEVAYKGIDGYVTARINQEKGNTLPSSTLLTQDSEQLVTQIENLIRGKFVRKSGSSNPPHLKPLHR